MCCRDARAISRRPNRVDELLGRRRCRVEGDARVVQEQIDRRLFHARRAGEGSLYARLAGRARHSGDGDADLGHTVVYPPPL